jgi:PAS domain S-box-containing protein
VDGDSQAATESRTGAAHQTARTARSNGAPAREGEVICVSARDLTEYRTLETPEADGALLSLSEEISGSGSWRLTFESGAVTWSPGMFRLFGIDPETFAGDASAHLSAVHPEDRPMLERVTAEVMKDLVPRPVDYRIVRSNDEVRWVHGEGTQELDADGTVVGLVGFYRDITELRQVEETLREERAALAEAQRVARLGSWQWDAVADTITWSDELFRIHGHDPDLPTPKYEEHLNMYTSESARRLDAAVKAAMKDGTCYELDLELLRPDGARLAGVARGEPVLGPDGGVVGLHGTLLDITDRKHAEEMLRESQARLDLALRSAGMGACHSDLIEDRRYLDEQACHLLGIDPATFAGTAEEFLGAVHPDDVAMVKASLAQAIEQDVLYEPEYRAVWPDGSVHCLASRARVLRDDDGRPVEINGIVWDITDRKDAEDALRAASLYSRSLIEASLDPLVTIGPEGDISDVNRATEEVTGLTRDKLIGTDFSDYFTEPDKARQGYERVFAEGRVVDYPLAIRHASGKVTDVIYNAVVYCDGAGEVQGVFAAARDVTEAKRAHEQAARLAAIVTNSRDAIFTKDLHETVTTWNAGAEDLFGYSVAEMVGRDASLLEPQGREGESRRLTERVCRGNQIAALETQRKRKDGSLVDVSLTSSPILDDAGDVVAISAIGRDITERKETEEELRRLNQSLEDRVEDRTRELSQAVEELEQALKIKDVFLSSMSHELRTPLNSVIGFSAILESGAAGELPAEAHRQIGFIHESGKQLLAVVNTLLDSASIAAGLIQPQIAAFELDEFLDTVESTMSPPVRAAHLAFAIRTPSEPVTLVSDGGKIREVLFNLIDNALKFTKQGCVTLDVTLDHGHVSFAVADTGVGIAPKNIDDIMEPFRQLPQPGVAKTRGAGLGLTISAKIAAALGGEIMVESELGVGSTFTLTVPVQGPDSQRVHDGPP